MVNYLKAENLKLKHTFTKKLIIIMPMISLLMGALAPAWYEVNTFNWWYIMIFPGTIALICSLVHQKEEKKLKYRGVMCLPIDLKKLWISKALLIGIYIFISCIILSLGIFPGRFIFSSAITNPISITKIIIGAVVITITSLWQVPFCLFLAKKVGLFPTILINTVVGIVLNMLTVDKKLWWLFPYSFTSRLMCPILGILPNGCLAETGNPLLNSNVIWSGIALSILFFILLILVTAHWFSKQEVK